MKDKIENLIKEIGINEVETILKQMKSKVNVKQKLKKDFVELLSNCTTSLNHNDVEYRKKDKLLFYYQKNKNVFHFKYVIWSNFESKYNLNYHELKELLVGVVEDVLNYKGVTPGVPLSNTSTPVEDVLNYKGVTPDLSNKEPAIRWRMY